MAKRHNIMTFVNCQLLLWVIVKKLESSDKIKKIRKIARLSQAEFAKKIGLPAPSTISDYEKGKTSPSGPIMLAIEYKFGHLYEVVKDKYANEDIIPKDVIGAPFRPGEGQYCQSNQKSRLADFELMYNLARLDDGQIKLISDRIKIALKHKGEKYRQIMEDRREKQRG